MLSPSGVDAPLEVKLSPEEQAKSCYGVANIQRALEGLHQDGFVVLKSIIDLEHIKKLNEYMTEEAEVLVRTNAKPFNQGVNCASESVFFCAFLRSVSRYGTGCSFKNSLS